MNTFSPREIDRILDTRGLAPAKRFGQNFLINPGAVRTLVETATAGRPDTIWEIGPGIGTLTERLVGSGAKVTAFEIDAGFVELLRDRFAGLPGLRLIPGDFLETWRSVLSSSGPPAVIVGNLPYNVASRIVIELFVAALPSKLVVTVQREVAARMNASPSDADYSSYSIVCRTGFHIHVLGHLKPGSFYPRPRVASSMLELVPRREAAPTDREFFMGFCRCLFAARRKTVGNNLRRCSLLEPLSEAARLELLVSHRVSPGDRAEHFAPDLVVRLAESFRRAILSGHPRTDHTESE